MSSGLRQVMADLPTYSAVGRRKRSVARVYLRPGNGNIRVNRRNMKGYFHRDTLCMIACEPLEHVGMLNRFDCEVAVYGGGISGQAGAVRLGIARAVLRYDEALRSRLRERGFLTRDARVVERKKVGLRKARKDKQFSKR